ncbi:MAG: hypothetical protein I3273_07865 [Candidatus Moeniiplasma glomeromycotorum]|nr:hypothetical protein [Candidatus Moeniiplasma glomeromycotorum]
MPIYQKKPHSKFIILLLIIFFHLLPVLVSAYYDKALHPRHQGIMRLGELRYWLWFFTWWSAWTSLLTIPWAIYKMFNLSKKSTYWEQTLDLIITEANLISGIIFCCGGFLLTYPRHSYQTIPYPVVGKIKIIYVYLFYNLFWHILAPSLVFYFFWKYCSVNKVAKRKKNGLLANFSNLTIYFFYVFLRPLLSKFRKIDGSNLPHKYPRDYPYALFFWSVGKSGSSSEEKARLAGNNKSYFWHKWPIWQQSLFWLLIIFVLGYLTLFLLFHFLIKIKIKQSSLLIK